MSDWNLHTVDAFTTTPFRGNPAAVCWQAGFGQHPPEALMQALAAELRLSETAFIWRRGGPVGADCFGIRWFTPTTEVELCGHATLAAAHVLYELGLVEQPGPIDFLTQANVRLRCEPGPGVIAMTFPADAPRPDAMPTDLLTALAITPSAVLACERGRSYWLIEVGDEATVRACRPNFAALAETGKPVGITARGDEPRRIVSRFFAPSHGIDEDPVTGSWDCLLAPYWSERLGEGPLQCRQLSARGGELTVLLEGSQVRITGSAVSVLRATLTLPDA